MSKTIKDLFANQIDRHIEEVIKVDQADEEIVRNEIGEYVVTASICKHYRQILDRYWETPNKPHEGIGIWVSGFFGSGKSSFAKNLGFALENRDLKGENAGEALRRPNRGRRRKGPSFEHWRTHSHPGGNLRRFHRQGHSFRKPDSHGNHVPPFSGPIGLRQGPRPCRTGNYIGGRKQAGDF